MKKWFNKKEIYQHRSHDFRQGHLLRKFKKLNWEWKLFILIILAGFIITSIQKGELTLIFFTNYIEYFKLINNYLSDGASYFFGWAWLFDFLIQGWYYTLLTASLLVILFKLIFGKY